jgi:RNA polymerase sigma-70 factor (ECF subfamily)
MQVDTAPADARDLSAELHARLRRFIHTRIGDAHAADDVAQEVLLRLYAHIGAIRSEERLDAFAYRVARNATIDYYRSRASAKETSTAPGDLPDHLATDSGDQDDLGRAELARCLDPLVQRLPEPYRDALRMTDLGELSQVDAARALGLSVPGMKSRVQRARAQVRDLLTSCCEVALDDRRRIAEVKRTGACACSPD